MKEGLNPKNCFFCEFSLYFVFFWNDMSVNLFLETDYFKMLARKEREGTRDAPLLFLFSVADTQGPGRPKLGPLASRKYNPKVLFVANLPPITTEGGLRELFGEIGVVADIRIMYTNAGEFLFLQLPCIQC